MIDLENINVEWADAICRGRRHGYSWQRIADDLGVNRGSVYRFAKKHRMTDLEEQPQTGFRPLGRFELMHPFERRGLERPGQEGMFDDEIAADNAAKAAADAEAGRGELTDADIALVDDAVAAVDKERFENLVVGLPWSESMSTDAVEWVEEHVTLEREPEAPITWDDLTPNEKGFLDRFRQSEIVQKVGDEDDIAVAILRFLDLVEQPDGGGTPSIRLTASGKDMLFSSKPSTNFEPGYLKSRGVAGEARADRILAYDPKDPPLAWLMLLCTFAMTVASGAVLWVVTGVPAPW